MKKRILVMFLIMATSFILPFVAHAASVEDLMFDAKTRTITGCNTEAEGELVIPTEIDGTAITKIGGAAFWYCAGLTKITLPDGLTVIDEQAFTCCKSVTDINIPSSVTTINNGAFQGCAALTEITIPEGITAVADYTFEGCENLETVNLPSRLTSIGKRAFSGCIKLSGITIPNTVTDIEEKAFYFCKSLETIHIPQTVETIGGDAFFVCSALQKIETDENNAFFRSEDGILFDKNKTTLIKYPEGKTLTRYSVPSGITELSSHALALCPLLTDIELPDTLETIGDEVCWSCDGLNEITVPASVTSVGDAPFVSCDGLEKINVDENNPNFTSVNGVLFDKSAATLIQYPAGKSDTQYDIPDTVTRIACESFADCDNLIRVTLLLRR